MSQQQQQQRISSEAEKALVENAPLGIIDDSRDDLRDDAVSVHSCHTHKSNDVADTSLSSSNPKTTIVTVLWFCFFIAIAIAINRAELADRLFSFTFNQSTVSIGTRHVCITPRNTSITATCETIEACPLVCDDLETRLKVSRVMVTVQYIVFMLIGMSGLFVAFISCLGACVKRFESLRKFLNKLRSWASPLLVCTITLVPAACVIQIVAAVLLTSTWFNTLCRDTPNSMFCRPALDRDDFRVDEGYIIIIVMTIAGVTSLVAGVASMVAQQAAILKKQKERAELLARKRRTNYGALEGDDHGDDGPQQVVVRKI